MNIGLAMVYHDPQGRLYNQIVSSLPSLATLFGGIAVHASAVAPQASLEQFAAAGVCVHQRLPAQGPPARKIGRARRAAIELALQLDCPFIMYCDCDRILHWAEAYPQELAHVIQQLPHNDLTVLGRTERAFASHPRAQRETEAIVNHVFSLVSGYAWDVTAAARGLSRRAIEAIVAECFDDEFSTDVSWPLFIQKRGGFSCGYLVAEGLEFETVDRYGDEVLKAGGQAQWLAQRDNDPRRWIDRLKMAQIELEAMLPYIE